MCNGSNISRTQIYMVNFRSSQKISIKIESVLLSIMHCCWSVNEPVYNLEHCIPQHGRQRPGKPNLMFWSRILDFRYQTFKQPCRTESYGVPKQLANTTRHKQQAKIWDFYFRDCNFWIIWSILKKKNIRRFVTLQNFLYTGNLSHSAAKRLVQFVGT